MDEPELKPNHWYWLRRADGSLAPYRFYRVVPRRDRALGEFFVGSFVRTFPLSQVVGEAQMPANVSKSQFGD